MSITPVSVIRQRMHKTLLALLLAALLLASADGPALAGGLVDYSQTPWGSPRDAVLKKLRRTAGSVAKSEHTDALVVSLGSISTGSWRYQLKGTYQFHQGRLYRIDLRPLAEKGGAITPQKLAELYRDLVGHHRAEFGSPRLVDGKCEESANCRRTEWVLDKGRSVLSVSEVLDPARQYVNISCYSATVESEIKKSAEKPRKRERRGLHPGKKFF